LPLINGKPKASELPPIDACALPLNEKRARCH
jgi:hypothetical protein